MQPLSYTLVNGKARYAAWVCVFSLYVAFAFHTGHFVYANGVYSCRAAGLNENLWLVISTIDQTEPQLKAGLIDQSPLVASD